MRVKGWVEDGEEGQMMRTKVWDGGEGRPYNGDQGVGWGGRGRQDQMMRVMGWAEDEAEGRAR